MYKRLHYLAMSITTGKVGTVQKDWAIVLSNALPENFCIAVVSHEGWSHDPDFTARYALTVSFAIIGRQIPIYDDLRAALGELRPKIEAAVEEAEVATA